MVSQKIEDGWYPKAMSFYIDGGMYNLKLDKVKKDKTIIN